MGLEIVSHCFWCFAHQCLSVILKHLKNSLRAWICSCEFGPYRPPFCNETFVSKGLFQIINPQGLVLLTASPNRIREYLPEVWLRDLGRQSKPQKIGEK